MPPRRRDRARLPRRPRQPDRRRPDARRAPARGAGGGGRRDGDRRPALHPARVRAAAPDHPPRPLHALDRTPPLGVAPAERPRLRARRRARLPLRLQSPHPADAARPRHRNLRARGRGPRRDLRADLAAAPRGGRALDARGGVDHRTADEPRRRRSHAGAAPRRAALRGVGGSGPRGRDRDGSRDGRRPRRRHVAHGVPSPESAHVGRARLVRRARRPDRGGRAPAPELSGDPRNRSAQRIDLVRIRPPDLSQVRHAQLHAHPRGMEPAPPAALPDPGAPTRDAGPPLSRGSRRRRRRDTGR